MYVSKTQIANLALSHLHTRSTIADVETGTSVEAKAANLWFDVARLEVLADYNWGFARRRKSLATHGEAAPTDEWKYRFEYPSDCVAARYIVNPAGDDEDAVPYAVEYAEDGTKSIVTDVGETACLVYTTDIGVVDLFPPHFIVALSYKLAFYVAGTLSHKKSLVDQVDAGYFRALFRGAATDGNESVSKKPRDAEHIRARGA